MKVTQSWCCLLKPYLHNTGVLVTRKKDYFPAQTRFECHLLHWKAFLRTMKVSPWLLTEIWHISEPSMVLIRLEEFNLKSEREWEEWNRSVMLLIVCISSIAIPWLRKILQWQESLVLIKAEFPYHWVNFEFSTNRICQFSTASTYFPGIAIQ